MAKAAVSMAKVAVSLRLLQLFGYFSGCMIPKE
jgi:hypothetical protein